MFKKGQIQIFVLIKFVFHEHSLCLCICQNLNHYWKSKLAKALFSSLSMDSKDVNLIGQNIHAEALEHWKKLSYGVGEGNKICVESELEAEFQSIK